MAQNSDSDPDINEDALEEIIPEAVRGNKEALNLLLYCKWLCRLLDRIARWARIQYEVEADEHGRSVQDVVSDKIREKIGSLENPNHSPWGTVLTAWAFSIARNHSLNVIRHWGVEQRHTEADTHLHSEGKRNGREIIVPSSPMLSQEEEIERREQDELASTLRRRLRQVIDSFTPEDARIVKLWAQGKTLREISEELGIPLSTVGKRLAKLQKEIVKEVDKVVVEAIGEATAEALGITQVLATHRAGLRELIAHSLLRTA